MGALAKCWNRQFDACCMIVLSHPTGNANVRAVLGQLNEAELLLAFFTTLVLQPDDRIARVLPAPLRQQLLRRNYDLPAGMIKRSPLREATRQLATRFGIDTLIRHETGWASVDAVYRDLDANLARRLKKWGKCGPVRGVYAYEDGALQSFEMAKTLGLKCFYELPIAYWETSGRLLHEEAERWPHWEPTLVGTRDRMEKLKRKARELELADVVIVPSRFVFESLPEHIRQTRVCHIVPFGSPVSHPVEQPLERTASQPLRVLFAGSMTQRKGLADLFAAMNILNRPDIELVVMGSLQMPLDFYRRQAKFRYESPRPHAQVLELMRQCDILALPSIVEGRALVQQEAMSCGLPLLVTANAGGDDLIDEGETGWLVPIRAPERIAARLDWLADHRTALPQMRLRAKEKARQYTWERYGDAIAEIVASNLGERFK